MSILLLLFSCDRLQRLNNFLFESDTVWNSLLSKSITVLSVLFTCRDQQGSFWNLLFNQCFTNSQFQQKKKKRNTLQRRWNTHILSSPTHSTGNELIHVTPIDTSIYLPEMFPFRESLTFFFSTPAEKQKKKKNSAWLALGVEIAFLIKKLHSLKKASQYFRGDGNCHVTASFVLIFEICTDKHAAGLF